MDEDPMLATSNKMTGLDLASRPGTLNKTGSELLKDEGISKVSSFQIIREQLPIYFYQFWVNFIEEISWENTVSRSFNKLGSRHKLEMRNKYWKLVT